MIVRKSQIRLTNISAKLTQKKNYKKVFFVKIMQQFLRIEKYFLLRLRS